MGKVSTEWTENPSKYAAIIAYSDSAVAYSDSAVAYSNPSQGLSENSKTAQAWLATAKPNTQWLGTAGSKPTTIWTDE